MHGSDSLENAAIEIAYFFAGTEIVGMKAGSQDWIALLGRVLMARSSFMGGSLKAMAPAATMAYFARLGLPLPPAAYVLTLLVEIGGARAFLLGGERA